MLKNFLKKISFFYILLGIGICFGGYYYFFIKQTSSTDKDTASTTIELVGTGNLTETIDAVGTAELVDEQSLSFNKSGTIKSVFFKPGDKIKKGDIIAELDNTNGEISIKEAQINLDNAKINLQELYLKADESKILQFKNTIENTKTSIENLKKELENLKITQKNSINETKLNIENSKKELQTSKNSLLLSKNDLELALKELELSKNDLELSKKELELNIAEQSKNLSNTNSNKSTTIKQIENTFASDLTTISKIIEQADYILGVSEGNKTKNDDFELYLGAKNSSYKQQAETSLYSSIQTFENLKKIVDGYDKSGNSETIKFILDEFKKTYSILETTTDLVYKTLENTIIGTNLTQGELDNKKSSIYNYLTTIQNKSNSITSSINTLDTLTDTNLIITSNNNDVISKENAIFQKENTILSKENTILQKQASINTQEISIDKKNSDINTMEINLETTIKNNELIIKNKLDNISQSEKTIEVNEESLKELLEGPTKENIKKAQNSIAQAELKLKSAKESLDDYKLEAPFDGIIRKIDYMVGDNLSTEVDKYVYIENPNLLEIKVMLDQVDIGKVEVGTKAKIKFDAYSTQEVNAVISQIDTTPIESSGVTSYKITIILDDKNFQKKVLSGMTADIEIITQKKENIIIVSTKAIETENNKNYVTLQKSGNKHKIEVQVGMNSGGKTEIISGLSIGDKIIIKNYTVGDTSKTKTNSLFSPPTNRNRTSGSMGGPPGGF